jgi:hypothetical protein
MPDQDAAQDYKLLIQPEGPFDSYTEGGAPTLDKALALLEAAKYATWSDGGGAPEPVYPDADVLSIVGPDGKILKSWSRATGDIGPDLASEGRPPVIGWQIVNEDGYNIHGDDEDPFGLASYEVMTGGAVATAITWAAANPGYSVVPVREGLVEEPSFVASVSERPAPAPAP